ncbi:hypothetical protein MNB_SV-6-833 [hydrothermal vent metagenome]|uniref:Uncharacterized protein n=1 Tax=hydrothermal vent metagenome TaxID=652676 RepID=A0A1W1BNM7_9ZZZZ
MALPNTTKYNQQSLFALLAISFGSTKPTSRGLALFAKFVDL